MVGMPVERFKYHDQAVWFKECGTTLEKFVDVGGLVSDFEATLRTFVEVSTGRSRQRWLDRIRRIVRDRLLPSLFPAQRVVKAVHRQGKNARRSRRIRRRCDGRGLFQ